MRASPGHDRQHNFWLSTLPAAPASRSRLEGQKQADVAIVGAGFTGLWTAYYLKTLASQLDIVVLEAERVGYGASGRNGGWVIGNLAGLERHIGTLPLETRRACCRLLADNVDALGQVLAREAIAADFNKGGAIYAAARYPDQIAIQRDYLRHLHELGHDEDACRWLDAGQLAERVRFRKAYGGIFHRHVGTVNPARLVHGLAGVLERLGVTIFEASRAIGIERHTVTTDHGAIEAPMIACATEGYAQRFHDFKKHVIPIQSMVITTEPLPASVWQQIGMAERPAFADASRIITYGHRTADDRLVFG
ncbi:MAG: FAD-dependent oxidoreductase, partial [Halomonas sp.]|nr:FAD-dependent oxidoreductase [Halomonas sp.]